MMENCPVDHHLDLLSASFALLFQGDADMFERLLKSEWDTFDLSVKSFSVWIFAQGNWSFPFASTTLSLNHGLA